MKTLLWYFPIGTIRGTIFCYSLSAIYGTLASLSTIVQIVKRRKTFFHVKNRVQPNKCLNDRKLGEHHFVQLKVSFIHNNYYKNKVIIFEVLIIFFFGKLKNLKLHYVSNGDRNKPLMLFLHGFPEVWYSWRYQLPKFSQHYFSVALDMRGYGDSDKPEGKLS
jgi:hypothetical protein